MITETEFKGQVLKMLSLRGVWCWPYNSIGVYDKQKGLFRRPNSEFHIVGVSDVLGVYKGRFIAIELKRPKFSKSKKSYVERTDEELYKMASVEQVEFLDNVKKNGGIGILADSWKRINDGLFLGGVKNE